ncbi:hypothetical protein AREALGSMS7_01774 [Arenibacter algicola]|uniref:Uncharacterized protein n=1 Tax=Arenibacter algicola TaxID=616991 RepID=A0A221UVH5_9FLAO|nr:hypothetical protein AREALGSMS7_01774 [Arenibacter algicola]
MHHNVLAMISAYLKAAEPKLGFTLRAGGVAANYEIVHHCLYDKCRINLYLMQ